MPQYDAQYQQAAADEQHGLKEIRPENSLNAAGDGVVGRNHAAQQNAEHHIPARDPVHKQRHQKLDQADTETLGDNKHAGAVNTCTRSETLFQVFEYRSDFTAPKERDEQARRNQDREGQGNADDIAQVTGAKSIRGIGDKGNGADDRAEHGNTDKPPGIGTPAHKVAFRSGGAFPHEITDQGDDAEMNDNHCNIQSAKMRHDISLVVLPCTLNDYPLTHCACNPSSSASSGSPANTTTRYFSATESPAGSCHGFSIKLNGVDERNP